MAPLTFWERISVWFAYLPTRIAYRIIWLAARLNLGAARQVYAAMWDANLALPPLGPSLMSNKDREVGGVPAGINSSRALRVLLIVAPSYQGGHSHMGAEIAAALHVPFPITMLSLRAAAIDCGFRPYDLWPWLQGMEAPRDSDGSPEGEDALAASSETTARAEGIAKEPQP